MPEPATDAEVTELRFKLAEAVTDKKFADMLGEMRVGFADISARLSALERTSSGIKGTVRGTGIALGALIVALLIGLITFGQTGIGLGLSMESIAKAAATQALQQEHQTAPPAAETVRPQLHNQ